MNYVYANDLARMDKWRNETLLPTFLRGLAKNDVYQKLLSTDFKTFEECAEMGYGIYARHKFEASKQAKVTAPTHDRKGKATTTTPIPFSTQAKNPTNTPQCSLDNACTDFDCNLWHYLPRSARFDRNRQIRPRNELSAMSRELAAHLGLDDDSASKKRRGVEDGGEGKRVRSN